MSSHALQYKHNMKTILYVLLAPVRFTVSAIGFALVLLGIPFNWLLTGDPEHNKGLVGFLCLGWLAWMQDHVNNPLVKFHKELKPVAWTFKKAVRVYRECLRFEIEQTAADFLDERYARGSLAICQEKKDNRMTRYWTYVLAKAKVKRREDAIKWNKKCDEYEKNPREGYTMERSVVAEIDA